MTSKLQIFHKQKFENNKTEIENSLIQISENNGQGKSGIMNVISTLLPSGMVLLTNYLSKNTEQSNPEIIELTNQIKVLQEKISEKEQE